MENHFVGRFLRCSKGISGVGSVCKFPACFFFRLSTQTGQIFMRSDEKTKLIMKEKWNKFSVKVEVREYTKRSL